jgi:hypothetical protein
MKQKLDLTPREIEIIKAALPVYVERQMRADEDAGALRIANVERFAAAFPHKNDRYTPNQIFEMAEACEAYLYWEVSDPQDRDSGLVFYENEKYANSKMNRYRDPAYVARCSEVDALAGRLEAISHALGEED